MKKIVLLSRDKELSYDSANCYLNENPILDSQINEPSSVAGGINAQDAENLISQDDIRRRVLEEKESFYKDFFRRSFENVSVLCAAGTSMDNGEIKGKSREGLWESSQSIIDEIYNLFPKNEKLSIIDTQKDIEELLSYVILAEKVNLEKADRLKELREKLEMEIKNNCTLSLDKEKAPHKLFLNKITARKAGDSRVQLFTTNYDTLFEQAAQEGGFVMIDGFSFTHPRVFSGRFFDYDIINRERTRLKQEDSFVPRVFHLYKLHGSLTWEKKDGQIVQSENPERPLIIYPASNKYESSYEQPYFEMMSRFQQALRKENALLIVLGFGFRDKHIQNVILEAVNQNPSFQLVIVAYNKSGSINKEEFMDFFEAEDIKPNVTIVFDQFRDFTNSLPGNRTYLQNESIFS